MRRALLTTSVGLAAFVAGCSSGGSADTPSAQPAPLLDRDVFFGSPEVAYASLSPDGEWLAFARPHVGKLNLWVKPLDAPFADARPVTADRDRPVFDHFWSRDSRYILFTQDTGGNENFHIYAIEPEPAYASESVPPPRDLTPLDGVQARIYALPETSRNELIIGLNQRDAEYHDAFRLNIETGALTLLRENTFKIARWVADRSGRVRLGTRIGEAGDNEILRLDEAGASILYRCAGDETCVPIRFHDDGRRAYLITNRGARDLTELMLLDVDSGDTELVARDPLGEVDVSRAIFSRDDGRLLAVSYAGRHLRIVTHDRHFERDLERVTAALPESDLLFRSPTNDDRLWIVKELVDVDNGANYLYDRETGRVTLLYRPFPEIPREQMSRREATEYAARDGLTIPAYLTLPKGVAATNLPAVVLPHGGPWSRDSFGWDPAAQFLANRGYAVLQPNFRGSRGFGKRFMNLGDHQWGIGSMQHDLTDGVRWLVERGIADPQRIAIMGSSYGGYAALAGLTFTPDLYAAGISIVGPSNLITQFENIPPWWEPIRKRFSRRVGDPAVPKEREDLIARSPFFHADRIQAPLLVMQGANDPRVPRAESDQIVDALRALGRPVDYLVATDEGHGFSTGLNNLAAYAAIEAFLAEHLGGRQQMERSRTLERRLARLRAAANDRGDAR